ncbi:hypothetical protein SAMN05216321_11395 [Cupriavidus sp. OV038]|uniref:hypothetical protein n=1 Tax=unclassified Cupriavidus TaxID=2640874 RepID=UPI0008E80EDE|nr:MULTISPECIES: hypothetical protein [unclassified Cupriavidus]SFD18766.1 hypothetical protein SAMN05216321_11395 [Cupriavidus sp. OV038]SFP87860.1 hypothetical protein SAMN05216322_11292 [Cupriavidus sp. OV096]
MSQASTPQERVAAARQLYAVLKKYLDRSTWTPVEGALILSGLHAPAGCAEIPREATGLDGKPFRADVIDRLTKAREIMRLWEWSWDDEESGTVAPTRLEPHEFLAWCQDVDIDTEWIRLVFEVISAGKVQTDQPDLIPLSVAEYATQSAETISAIHALAGQVSSESSVGVPALKAVEKSAPRVPMPIPANRDHVSTEELAAILAIEPQSIRKRYSLDGSYLGIRPTKLPNRRLLWLVADVQKLVGGNRRDAAEPGTK